MNIKNLRKKKGITQLELARTLGLDQSSIAKWETNKYMPRAALFPKLAAALDCTIDDLFRTEIPGRKENEE